MSKIICLECNTILESLSRHDFVQCKCPNNLFLDGGEDYLRFGGKDLSKIGFWDEKEQKFNTLKISDKKDEQLELF